jgi:diguanylate cyclase (GGDEF)-like protein/PAS domain S-box-containing protein
MAVTTDSQPKQNHETLLLRSEERFRLLFEMAPIGMAMADHTTGRFLEANDALLRLTGYSREEFLALTYWDILPEEYREQQHMQIAEADQKRRFGPHEKEYIRKDGSRVPIKISGFLHTDPDGNQVSWGIIEDITERRAYEQAIQRLANHDPLTDLPNRRLFSDRLRQAAARAQREHNQLALLLFDLDKFKPVNDTFGHEVGDLLLKQVAVRAEKVLKRKSDTLARLGGDEFVILIPHIDHLDQPMAVAEMIRQTLSESFEIKQQTIFISCSIGIAIAENGGETELTLMNQADAALYQAKRKGGNCVEIYRAP